jgi:hypothetical protein
MREPTTQSWRWPERERPAAGHRQHGVRSRRWRGARGAGAVGSRRLLLGVAALLSAFVPASASAQLPLIEGLFRNVTDVGFHVGRSGLGGRGGELDPGRYGLSSFGIELLFEVGAVTRARPLARPDSVQLRWTEMVVVRSGGSADTTYTYVVAPVPRSEVERIWVYELAIGYGQLSGFRLVDSDFELLGSARELPGITFYLSHEATGGYLGLRSGLLQTHALQVVGSDGAVIGGSAQAFQVGALAGFSTELLTVFPFIEAGWLHRRLPSVEWRAGVLPAGVPRELDLSGWQIGAGIQVPLRR